MGLSWPVETCETQETCRNPVEAGWSSWILIGVMLTYYLGCH